MRGALPAHLPWVGDAGEVVVVTYRHAEAWRCTKVTMAFRRETEALGSIDCEHCAQLLVVDSEVLAACEFSAKAGVVRWRELDEDRKPTGTWKYAPVGSSTLFGRPVEQKT